jgi:hypothetical protein
MYAIVRLQQWYRRRADDRRRRNQPQPQSVSLARKEQTPSVIALAVQAELNASPATPAIMSAVPALPPQHCHRFSSSSVGDIDTIPAHQEYDNSNDNDDDNIGTYGIPGEDNHHLIFPIISRSSSDSSRGDGNTSQL